MEPLDAERGLRNRLGIPPGAERVIVFAETTHWDPNWLHTSDEYYESRVRHTLDAVVRELSMQPRRVFSVECTFFLKMYWDRNPLARDALRDLMNRGSLRLTGTGVTTPDTVVTGTESIVRDYLAGARWLRGIGVEQQPAVAYLPDNFGHTPALPTILRGMGYPYVTVSRIDGMRFVGDDFRPPWHYPVPSSSAKLLLDLASLDFTWRGPDGSEVLAHWNAFTYFQGDMLASRGIIRWMNRVLGWSDRSAMNVAGKIEAFARRLGPLSPTPYMLCPIGCDFNDPIPDLVGLLDRYNWARFPRTGIYAVNAGLEDYLRLVEARGIPLPVIDLDPNPYWMGFYATRPQFKQRIRALAHSLSQSERRLTESDVGADGQSAAFQALGRGWGGLVTTNHHDFVTGTAPDRVYRLEQSRWLLEAEEQAAIAAGHADKRAGARAAGPDRGLPSWTRDGDVLEVVTPAYRVRLDAAAGGCITGWWPGGATESVIDGPSNDLVAYKDSGGLWRMGHEFAGGRFRAAARASARPAKVDVAVDGASLRVDVEAMLDGRRTLRQAWFRNDTPAVRMRAFGSARRRRTVTCSFATAFRPVFLDMDVPGGVVRRPLVKVYDPTFWCARNFVHWRDPASDAGLAVLMGGPASVCGRAAGTVEWVVARNTPREIAFGFLPVPAHPAYGPNDDEHAFEYAVWLTPAGDWRANRLHVEAEALLWDEPAVAGSGEWSWLDCPARTDDPDVRVRAVKLAEDGRGVVVRMASFRAGPGRVRLAWDGREVEHATLCDARERDIRDVPVEEGRAVLDVAAGMVTVRVFLGALAA